MYVLSLATTPPIQWTEPDITTVGAEQSAINGEVPNLTITISNARGQHTARVSAINVLRTRATLSMDGHTIFVGAVQAVTTGADMIFELEA